MRTEYQVIIVGFIRSKNKYLILHRSDNDIWQFVSGGGEDDETPKEAAIRELYEETGIKADSIVQLDAMTTISAHIYKEHRDKENLYVIPEYAFAVELLSEDIVLSEEHRSYALLNYEECMKQLTYDSNRTALTETKERLNRHVL